MLYYFFKLAEFADFCEGLLSHDPWVYSFLSFIRGMHLEFLQILVCMCFLSVDY